MTRPKVTNRSFADTTPVTLYRTNMMAAVESANTNNDMYLNITIRFGSECLVILVTLVVVAGFPNSLEYLNLISHMTITLS